MCFGGRGAGRSWGVARLLIYRSITCYEKILCCREFQRSIDASVLTLLRDQIDLLGVSEYFEVQRNRITCTLTGSEFIFEGIAQNVTKIKSVEGVTIAWIEEAEKVSKNSYDVLIPTIRKENSEIWVTFNPAHEQDESYIRFISEPPPDSIIVQANYLDNPWFPETLLKEAEHLKATHYEQYEHIWLGVAHSGVAGSFFDADAIAKCFDYQEASGASEEPSIDGESDTNTEDPYISKNKDPLQIRTINYE